MGQDMSTWERVSYGQTESDTKMRAEHARYEKALREIADMVCTSTAAEVAAAALPPNGKAEGESP